MDEKKVKPALTFEQQLSRLRDERGLIIEDEESTIEKLKRYNYYRLSAYMKPYMVGEKFRPGTTFNQIVQLYEFDKKLRQLVMSILEPIEITIKTQVAYLLGVKYGPLGYKNKEFFKNEPHHDGFLKKLDREIESASKTRTAFILHHMTEYDGQLPIWVAVEIMSFTTISLVFKNMLNEDQREIARGYFGHDEDFVSSWLYTLSYVRNISAHHSRLFNRSIIYPAKLEKKERSLRFPDNRLFAVLFVAKKLCREASDWDSFLSNLHVLIDQFEGKPERNMIWFPKNWYDLLR